MSGHFFGSKTVKTRKPHRCHGCRRDMPPKSTMRRDESIFDGVHWRLYWCKTCIAYMSEWDFYEEEGIFEGEFIDEMPEEWEACRKVVEDAKETDQ